MNTEVRAALTLAGAKLKVHGTVREREVEGREASGGSDTAEEEEVANSTGEASSGGSSRGSSGGGASSSDGLTLRVGGSTLAVGVGLSRDDGLTLGVGSSALRVGVGLGGDNGLALRVGGGSLRVGVGLSSNNGSAGSIGGGTVAVGLGSRVTAAVTAITRAGGDLDVGDLGLNGVVTAGLDKLETRGVSSSGSALGGRARGAGLELRVENRRSVDSDSEGAVGGGTLLVLDETDEDLKEDLDQVSDADAVGERSTNSERSDSVGAGAQSTGELLETVLRRC